MNDEFDRLIQSVCQSVCQFVILAVGKDMSFVHLVSFVNVMCVEIFLFSSVMSSFMFTSLIDD